MNIDRMKFAWARGARIEMQNLGNVWSHMSGDSFVNLGGTPQWKYRIHPDDDHLQYGPLSTALREWATTDGDTGLEMIRPAITFLLSLLFKAQIKISAKNDTCLAALFLAEQLADEGL